MSLIREYAIEPTALRDWRDFRYIFEQLGFSEGRLALQLPSDWCRRLLGACVDQNDRKRIEIALARHSAMRLVAPPPLGGAKPVTWQDTVRASHQRRAVAGAILDSGQTWSLTEPPAREIGEVDEAFLAVRREEKIDCTHESLANAARPLVRLSSHVFLIDPYMHLQPLAGSRRTLEALARLCRQENCEYLTVITHTDRFPGSAREVEAALQAISHGRDRPRVEIHFVDPPDRDRIHHRFILSAIGAIRYDAGTAADRHTTNEVILVDAERHRELVEQYCGKLDEHGFKVTFSVSWPRRGTSRRCR